MLKKRSSIATLPTVAIKNLKETNFQSDVSKILQKNPTTNKIHNTSVNLRLAFCQV